MPEAQSVRPKGPTPEAAGPVATAEDMARELVAKANVAIQRVELLVEAKVPHWSLQTAKLNGKHVEPKGNRPIYWDREGGTDTPIFDRARLAPGAEIAGPAMIEGNDTTYAVAKGWAFTADDKNCFQFKRLETV